MKGVYDNSSVVVLSDHGMENMKDENRGYEVIDLREILREHGLLRFEDYQESGGTELNFIWCDDPVKLEAIEKMLEDFTIDDPELGDVKPLNVINRQEMKDGVDFGEHGKVRPMELYSEYWIDNPGGGGEGQLWPDLFIFPLYNYQVVGHGDIVTEGINAVGMSLGINVPTEVQFGFPGAHGGLQRARIPLVFKAPADYPGFTEFEFEGEVEIGDITPTIYQIMGWEDPPCVDGKPLPSSE